MVYYILSQPGFQTSSWHKRILSGLMSEKRAKRLTIIHASDEKFFSEQSIEENDILILIGSDEKWITSCALSCECYFKNRIVVLGNFNRRFSDKKFSIVSGDITNDVVLLYNYLNHYGKEKIALR